MRVDLLCRWCGNRFTRPNPHGPVPKYCSAAHKQRAHEARKMKQIAEDAYERGRRAAGT